LSGRTAVVVHQTAMASPYGIGGILSPQPTFRASCRPQQGRPFAVHAAAAGPPPPWRGGILAV